MANGRLLSELKTVLREAINEAYSLGRDEEWDYRSGDNSARGRSTDNILSDTTLKTASLMQAEIGAAKRQVAQDAITIIDDSINMDFEDLRLKYSDLEQIDEDGHLTLFTTIAYLKAKYLQPEKKA